MRHANDVSGAGGHVASANEEGDLHVDLFGQLTCVDVYHNKNVFLSTEKRTIFSSLRSFAACISACCCIDWTKQSRELRAAASSHSAK